MGPSQSNQKQIKITYTNPLIWLDPYVSEEEFSELSSIFVVKKIQTIEQYLDYANQKGTFRSISLICSGSLFQDLYQQLKTHSEQYQKIKQIYIFCYDVERNKHYRSCQKVVCVTNHAQKVIEMIKSQAYQIELPGFKNFKSNSDNIQINKSCFLTYLTYPIQQSKREQLIKRFVNSFNLAKAPSNISFPFGKYPMNFDPIRILSLYSENQQFSDYINKVLKTDNPEYIEEAHILIHDVHLAIKHFSSFAKREQIPSVLFLGLFLSPMQIENLKNSIGSSIQTFGFLSASTQHQIIEKNQFRKNAFFKIFIPKFFRDKKFMNLKLKLGYVDINKISELHFSEIQRVLFTMKSVFTVLRVYSQEEIDELNQKKEISIIQLLFGKDQILLYLNQNKKEFTLKIHDKLARATQLKCEKCAQILHLIGISSKRRVCLSDFNSREPFDQSFVLENAMNKMTGIAVEYDEQALKYYENPKSQQYSSLCKKCQAKVKCSGCFSQFCLCSLKDHNIQHLKNCHILVEKDLPRFIMIELNECQLSSFQTQYFLESQIKCSADAFLMMNNYQKAEEEYNLMIEKENFFQLDYKTQFTLYENRAESYRLKKQNGHLTTQQTSIEVLERCKKDYLKCYELVKDKKDQEYKKSKAFMKIGIVEEAIEQLRANKKDKKKMFHQALKNFQQSSQILASIKTRRCWTNQEAFLEVNIKNCKAGIYWKKQQFQKAIQIFQTLLTSIKTLERSVKTDEAKILQSTACCINQYAEKLDWKDLDEISNILKKSVTYSEQSFNLRLSLFGSEQKLTESSKQTLWKAQELLSECNLRLKKNIQKTKA